MGRIRIDRKRKRKENSYRHQPRVPSTICCAPLSWSFSRSVSRQAGIIITLLKIPRLRTILNYPLNYRGCNISNTFAFLVIIFVESSSPIFCRSSSNDGAKRAIDEAIVKGRGGRKVREARRALILVLLRISVSPKPKHSQHLGNRGSLSRLLRVVVGLQLPRSCSTCSSSPGQVVGVVKQSPPPRRRPRFGRGTRSTNRNRIFYDREEYRGGWKSGSSTRQGGREKVSGMERWGLNILHDIYIHIYTRIEELAKSWRKSDHR